MRKIALLATVLAVASASAVVAQQPGAPGGRGRGMGRGGPGMMDAALLKGITLTDAQKAKLEDIRKADREQMEAQRGQGGGRGEMEAIREAREKGDTATANRLMAEQRAKMDARRDEQIAKIRGILTSDQYATFDANVADLKKMEGMRGMGGGRRGGRPPQ